jgi:cytochrome c556
VTTQLRLMAGGTAVVAGLWFLTAAGAAPVLPKDTYKKVVEADIAQLQKCIATCAEDAKEAKRFGPTARSLAMMLAAYGEATGDANLKTDALKIADTLGKKDWKGAGDLAKKLAAKGGNTPLKSGELYKMSKYSLDEVMSPFRGGTVGGMNIEKDIRSIRDKKIPIDPAAVELLAARTAIISDFATHFPNDKATVSKAKTDQWTQFSKDTLELSRKLVDEAAKGKGASEKEIVRLVGLIDAKCVNCHKEFRDD